MQYKQIRARFDDETIRVYQAYSPKIADEAIRLGTFGKSFKMERMTWIKPSFLWMMYRSGWATKEGQTRILAIDIKRGGFDKMLASAVISHYDNKLEMSRDDWKKAIQSSNVRVQWDPERDIYGNKLEYRSLQLGIKDDMVWNYVNNWILQITDITDYVIELRELRSTNSDEVYRRLPTEAIYLSNE